MALPEELQSRLAVGQIVSSEVGHAVIGPVYEGKYCFYYLLLMVYG